MLAEIAAHEAAGKSIEIWWQDEVRIGQKNKITRRWARRGSLAAPHDQRTRSAQGKGAALVLPRRTSEAMALHLMEISRAVAPDAHAVVLLEQPWTIMSIGLRDWAHRS